MAVDIMLSWGFSSSSYAAEARVSSVLALSLALAESTGAAVRCVGDHAQQRRDWHLAPRS
jgi:hypothetical protein